MQLSSKGIHRANRSSGLAWGYVLCIWAKREKMKKLDRRTFVGLSAAAVACAFSKQIPGQSIPPHIAADDQSVHVSSARYSWSYSRDDDTFRLLDAKRRLIVTGSLQPAVVVASSADPSRHQCVPGRALPPQATAGRVRFDYETVTVTAIFP